MSAGGSDSVVGVSGFDLSVTKETRVMSKRRTVKRTGRNLESDFIMR